MIGSPQPGVYQARLRRKKAYERSLKDLADQAGLAAHKRRVWLRSQIAKLEYSLRQAQLPIAQ